MGNVVIWVLTSCVCGLILLYFLLAPASSIIRLPHASVQVLVVFVAVGPHKERGEVTRRAIWSLPTKTNDNVEFRCLVFDYARYSERLAWTDKLPSHCSLVRNTGWSYAMFLRSLSPSLVPPFDFVVIVLDDVELSQSFSFSALIDSARKHSLDWATPCVVGSDWDVTRCQHHHRPFIDGRLVNGAEVFVSSFSKRLWPCFWQLLDMEFDGAGGWIARWTSRICPASVPNMRVGVLDMMNVTHIHPSRRVAGAKAKTMQSVVKMRRAWKTDRNITLPAFEDIPGKTFSLLCQSEKIKCN